MKYKTRQKELIYEYFNNHKNACVSAANLKQYLQHEAIGLTTIYRCLQELENENIIRKFIDEEANSAIYEYIEEDKYSHSHYHLKCNSCGEIIHLECHTFKALTNHVKEAHDFIIDPLKSTFYGVCKECSKTHG